MFLNGNCLESLKKEEPEGGRRRLSHPGNMGWMRSSQEMTPLNRSHYSGFGLFCGDPGPEIEPFSLQSPAQCTRPEVTSATSETAQEPGPRSRKAWRWTPPTAHHPSTSCSETWNSHCVPCSPRTVTKRWDSREEQGRGSPGGWRATHQEAWPIHAWLFLQSLKVLALSGWHLSPGNCKRLQVSL
uniref:Uncharacterized protein n=1 Tax=Papio anubis TaxID=9555 RepID=A0A2I3M764_PAPAN